jgi:hypothetical protein
MVGNQFEAKRELANHLLPLLPQDIADAIKGQGGGVGVDKKGVHVTGTPEEWAKGAALGAPGIFGVGVQTYRAAYP